MICQLVQKVRSRKPTQMPKKLPVERAEAKALRRATSSDLNLQKPSVGIFHFEDQFHRCAQ